MKTSIGLILLTLGLAPLLDAQEYKIQMHRPAKAGQEFQLLCNYQETVKGSASFLGRTSPEQRTNFVAELDARIRVLEADSRGRITKASCLVSNFVRVEGRYKPELVPPDTKISASAEEGKVEILVNGRPAEPEVQKVVLVALELNATGNAPTADEAFGTDTPKKIGESWDVKPEPLTAAFRPQMLGMANVDIEGRTTLEKLVKVQETECLELASKIYLKKFTLPLPPGVRTPYAFGAIRWSGKFPLDVSMAPLEESFELNLDFTVQAAGGRNSQGVKTKTSVVVKRTLQRRYLK